MGSRIRIAVTGTKGQIVQSLLSRCDKPGLDVLTVGRPKMDLADPVSVTSALEAVRPDIVVSAAAYTAVDRAESEVETAFALNAAGAEAVAMAAKGLGIPIVHISTDYVFNGKKLSPYVETDETDPISVYGRSKLEGERLVAAANANHAILRTAWVYSPYGANFLRTMLRLSQTGDRLRVVGDQRGCPTSGLDIADAIMAISIRMLADSDAELRGVFHLTGSGVATWAEFAEDILSRSQALGGRTVSVEHIATSEYATSAQRPANSLLSGAKLAAAYGITLPEWQHSTDIVMKFISKNEI
jgi:dTDP-4-dehydrorhamnose reductase